MNAERQVRILRVNVQNPQCPSYFRLQKGEEMVKLDDIRNENPFMESAVDTQINGGNKLAQRTFFDGILVYQAHPGIDTYGLPPKK